MSEAFFAILQVQDKHFVVSSKTPGQGKIDCDQKINYQLGNYSVDVVHAERQDAQLQIKIKSGDDTVEKAVEPGTCGTVKLKDLVVVFTHTRTLFSFPPTPTP
jgi:hypothetical protein